MEDLNYKITGDNSHLKKSLEESYEGTKKLDEAINKVGERLGEVAAAFVGFEAIKDFLGDSFKAFRENEVAAHDLANAVGASGGLLSNYKELQEQANQLSETGIFSKMEIEKAQTMGLQLGLMSEQVKKLIPIGSDLAAKMLNPDGTKYTLDQMMGHIDKFLRTGKDKALATVGITGGKTLEERMALFQKGGKGFAGGNIDAALNTTEGKLKNLANQWEEIKVSVGTKIADLFNLALPYIKKFLGALNEIGDWIRGHSESFNKIFSKIGAWIQPFINEYKKAFNEIYPVLMDLGNNVLKFIRPIMDLFNFLKPYVLELMDGFISFYKTIYGFINHVFKIGYSIYQILDKLGAFKFLGELFNSVWNAIKGIGNSLMWIYNNIIEPILNGIEWALDKLKGILHISTSGAPILSTVLAPNSPNSEKGSGSDDDKTLAGLFSGKKLTPNLAAEISPSKNESPRENITLNITKLVEQLVVQTTNLTESPAKIKELMAEALQEAVYGVKYAGH